MSSSLTTIEIVEEGTSDLDFLIMTPNFPDFTIDNLPSFSNSIDFSSNPSLLPPITNTSRQETMLDNPPNNAAYFPNPSTSNLLTKQQPKRRVNSNQSLDRSLPVDLNPPKNLSSLTHKKSDSNGVFNSVSPTQEKFSTFPTEGMNSVKIPNNNILGSQPQRSKLRRLRKPMNNSKKSSSPPTSLPPPTQPSQSSSMNLSINTNIGFDYSQRLKTPSSSGVNCETSPLFPEYVTQVDQVNDEDDVFLKEEEITDYCSDRVCYSTSAFDSYQLEDMDSQEMFDSFTPILLHSDDSDDPFMDDEVDNSFLYQPKMDALNVVIPPPLLMTQANSSSLMAHYIPPIQQGDKSVADKSKKSLRRASKNKTQKPILPSTMRNEVVPSLLVRVESKETVSTASESCESTSQTSTRSKTQVTHHTTGASSSIQHHSKPKQPDNPNKQITFCDSGYELPTKKQILTPQIQFVSSAPKAPQGISKPCKMSTSSGWKFHNFDREKQPIRDSSGFTYHFYEPKSKIAATTQ